MPELIRIDQVSKIYRRAGSTKVALDGVSFSIGSGDRLGIVGESGSGKSTLARIMTLLDSPTSGEVVFEGRPISVAVRREILDFRQKVQIVFQDPNGSLDPRLPIGESIMEPMRSLRIRGNHKEMMLRLLDSVRLGRETANFYPHHLSGGQKQRVAIARALAPSPQILIADEAVSALDIPVRAQILNLLNRIVADTGLTLVFISHDINVIRYMCTQVLVLYKGKVVEHNDAEPLFANPQHSYTKSLLESAALIDKALHGEVKF